MTVELIPILSDNYVFCLRNTDSNKACLVDPGDAGPCLHFLEKNNLELTEIFITHHHQDHIAGIETLKQNFTDAQIYAPLKNRNQIPKVDHWLKDQDLVHANVGQFLVIELPGHTLGHIAYFNQAENIIFSGDVLFGLGCGRLFEGTPQVKYESLAKLKLLPPETLIYCTHEYTERNLQFLLHLRKLGLAPANFDNDIFESYQTKVALRRGKHQPTVPLSLQEELKVNPFFLAGSVEEFSHLRQLRNLF